MHSYKRIAAAFGPTQLVDHAESLLLEAASLADDREVEALLKRAVGFIQKAKEQLEQKATSLQPALDDVQRALDASGREVERPRLHPTGISLSYHVFGFPRYPPDDDGPGDAAYYQQVREEVQRATRLVQDALRDSPQKFKVEISLQEKGWFKVEVSTTR